MGFFGGNPLGFHFGFVSFGVNIFGGLLCSLRLPLTCFYYKVELCIGYDPFVNKLLSCSEEINQSIFE